MTTTTRQPNAAGNGGDVEHRRPPSARTGERRRIADIIIPEGGHASETSVLEIAASMEEVGQLQPILITPAGELVAGLNRLRACERLGHETIEVKVVTLDDLRLRLATIDENLIRKNLDALERAEMIHERKRLYEALHPQAARPKGGRPRKNAEFPPAFSKVTAHMTGRDPRSIQTDVQIAAMPQEVRDQIRDKAVAGNKQELLKLARCDEQRQRKLAEKLARGEVKHLHEAERAVRIEEARARAEALPPDIPDCQVYQCSCEDLITRIEPESVDLILADPPYGEAQLLSCCDQLGRLAAHALTPDGSLLVMVGQMHGRAAEQVLEQYLFARWQMVYLMRRGGSPVVPTVQRRVNSRYKPVLWLTRPEYAGPVHGDVIEGGPKAKLNHEWEQDVEGAARIIELFSHAGEMVVDPFLCTGTTGVAALRLGRRFVGSDIDEVALVGARVRLHEASSQAAA